MLGVILINIAQADDLIKRFEENFKKFGPEVEEIANTGGFNK